MKDGHTFLEALRSGRVLLMDGAMGTALQRAGRKLTENAASWNVAHPERVRAVHQAYRQAGAEVLLTNTFQANRAALPLADCEQVDAFCREGARLARQAAGSSGWILADIGPIVAPGSCREFIDLTIVDAALDCISPVDAVLLETCSSPRVYYAVRRVRTIDGEMPVLLSLTYRRDRDHQLVTFSGHSPEWFGERAARWGLAALGVNCGCDVTVADCAAIVRRYRGVTDLPLFARPNAGTPKKVRSRWVYLMTPSSMAEQLPELLEAGVSMVGGCCGTTPEHIAALRPVVDRWNRRLLSEPKA